MASKIEQTISDIEDFIEGCKSVPFSSGSIAVNREEIEALLEELKSRIPTEIKQYQRIISNQEAILADARKKADSIVAQAQVQTNELVSEHQIMQQAYAQANEVVQQATKQAQAIMDDAQNKANNIQASAIAYTDKMLKSIEEILSTSMETTRVRTDTYLNTMQGYLSVVQSNRNDLAPSLSVQVAKQAAPAASEQKVTKDNGPSVMDTENK